MSTIMCLYSSAHLDTALIEAVKNFSFRNKFSIFHYSILLKYGYMEKYTCLLACLVYVQFDP